MYIPSLIYINRVARPTVNFNRERYLLFKSPVAPKLFNAANQKKRPKFSQLKKFDCISMSSSAHFFRDSLQHMNAYSYIHVHARELLIRK